MADKNIVIDHLKFSYEGLFNATELHALIAEFFYSRGWDWHQKMNEELITPEGKQIKIVFEPWKNISDYYKIKTKIKLNLTDLKDVEIEHEKETLKLNQGLIRMTFDAYVFNDRKDVWAKKPFYWFLTVIFDKYFFKSNYDKSEHWVKHDIDELLYKIKSFLNTYKYMYQT
ncbi:hypothetical protein HOA91_04330 [Candidatus Woesearchaeota archaeon]|nr:hypothetical protein [Candidatus Woesearchaeota archaeon]